jgi:hypothetical protein
MTIFKIKDSFYTRIFISFKFDLWSNGFIIKCIDSVVKTILNAEEEIEHLDRAIGDGDHYINIKRG